MDGINEELLLEYINGQKNEESLEVLFMSHLKMSAIYWSLATLFLLKGKEAISFSPMNRDEILEFIINCRNTDGGFGGNVGLDSHVLFTLSAIQILKMLESLDLLEKDKVAEYILSLENTDGSFKGDKFGEVDTRFSYCALMALYILGKAERESIDSALKFVECCRNWDGGFGMIPGAESHSGQIFCCQAIFSLFGEKGSEIKFKEQRLGEWLCWRQTKVSGGLNGRPQKLEDVCYSWWILSALDNIGYLDSINRDALAKFIILAQDDCEGAIADRPGDLGDIFHSFFGIAGLCLLGKIPNHRIDPILCLPIL